MMKKVVVLAAMVVVCIGAFAQAAALDNTHMGTKANAMGKAFTGLADDPSAVFYNPAGLVFQREGLSVQAYGLYVMTDLTYKAGQLMPPNTMQENASDESVLFPGFFLNYHQGDVAIGMGVYLPYGGGKFKYEDFGGVPGLSIEQSLGLMAFGGSVAVKLSERFSVGVSLTGYMGMYTYKKTVPSAMISASNFPQEDDISGVAAVGGNFGFLFKASETLTLGATAKLPVRITVDGETTFGAPLSSSFDSSAELRLPWYITFGMALKASPELTITFDFNYALYSTMDKYTFLFRGYGVAPANDGMIKDIRTGYTDATYFALGVDYKASDVLSLRGGVTFTPHATLDDALMLSCDVSHLTIALGAGYKFAPEFELTLSMHYLMGFERTITGATGVPGATGEQTFNKNALMIMAGINLAL
jgi:long-chain fatty acid transport protein